MDAQIYDVEVRYYIYIYIYMYTHTHQDWAHTMLPSDKHTKNYGTSPFLNSVDQLFRLVHFSIAKC